MIIDPGKALSPSHVRCSGEIVLARRGCVLVRCCAVAAGRLRVGMEKVAAYQLLHGNWLTCHSLFRCREWHRVSRASLPGFVY